MFFAFLSLNGQVVFPLLPFLSNTASPTPETQTGICHARSPHAKLRWLQYLGRNTLPFPPQLLHPYQIMMPDWRTSSATYGEGDGDD
jgi:hypothetical protein